MGRKTRGKRTKGKSKRSCRKLPCTIEPADHQVGTSNLKYDRRKKALPPGKRISKSGKTYYEYRRNRSDLTLDEIPPGVRRKLKQGLKSRKKGAVVMDHQQCIARADGMKLVLMPPSDSSHIPFAAVTVNGKEVTGTYLQVRDSILHYYGGEKLALYNRLLRKCWSHPGVQLWKIWLPVRAGTYPRPFLILDADGRKIGLRCRDGLLKPSSVQDESRMVNLIAGLSEKERRILRQALIKYSKILCRG